jgi:hypothetical protein
VPDDQRVRGVSTLADGDGNVTAEWTKTERKPNDPPALPLLPEGHHVRRTATMLDRQGKALIQWQSTEQDKVERDAAFWAAAKEHAAEYRGLAAVTAPPPFVERQWLSSYLLGDAHLGMLAWAPETGQHHDLSIAVRDLETAFRLLVEGAPRSHTGMLVNVGDYFHAQDDQQRTPGHGNKLDVDGRRAKVFRGGIDIMRVMISILLTRHQKVLVDNLPGNHDPDMAFMIAELLRQIFSNEPRVEIREALAPYHALEFGQNMILTAHGDGAARKDMPGLAAARFPEMWGRTRYRRAFTGHRHHEAVQEYPGMTVETVNILSPGDYWHKWKGYDAAQFLSCISCHEEYGFKARNMIGICEVRDNQ